MKLKAKHVSVGLVCCSFVCVWLVFFFLSPNSAAECS